jgi:preprotein translocase subunit YajC
MFITPAYAQSTAAAGSGGSSAFMVQVLPLLLIFVVFYFLILRPQNKRMKDHKAKIEAVKKRRSCHHRRRPCRQGGEGRGRLRRDRAAQGVKVRAVKSTLTDIIDPASAKPAND